MYRRNFLKSAALTVLPATIPIAPAFASDKKRYEYAPPSTVKFYGDGEMFQPAAYIDVLKEMNSTRAIASDSYGKRGVVEDLEKKFCEITGKERAVFMPTGTMANQFAIAVLSGENTKVFVQETSHVFRDEADAAQSVFNKRLIPLAKGETGFTAEELQQSVDYHNRGEVFKSGMGCVSIENPVRRTNGRMIPFEELKKIQAYCKQQNLRLHLDGARLFMASAWSGVSIRDYSSLFDTVYISLYKYLGAAAGAMLCGDRAVIDKMEHLIKIHGGTMFSNWANAAMALNRVEGFESRLKSAIARANELITAVNGMTGIRIEPLKDGTNIYGVKFTSNTLGQKFVSALEKDHNIRMYPPNEAGESILFVNETILYQDGAKLVSAFRESLKKAV